jgi:phage terminase large subunit
MYRYKVDPVTKQVLPIIVDSWNHGWDALRYSHDGFIQRRGAVATWGRL